MGFFKTVEKYSPSVDCVKDCAVLAYTKAKERIEVFPLSEEVKEKEVLRLMRFYLGVLYAQTKMDSKTTATFVKCADEVSNSEGSEDIIKAMALVYNRYAYNAAQSTKAKTNVVGKLMGTPDYSSDQAFADALKLQVFGKNKPLAEYFDEEFVIRATLDYTEISLRFKRG